MSHPLLPDMDELQDLRIPIIENRCDQDLRIKVNVLVAIDGDYVIIGAKWDDDKGSNSGSAYIYETCSVEISADPKAIQTGETAALTWESTNADLVTIAPDIGNVAASGTVTVAPTQTTTYAIAASGSYGAVEKSATVYVGSGPPTASISATPGTIESAGASSTLAWRSIS